MRHKKGISPLIATVLILGFTVALAAIIMVWGQRFTTTMQKQTEETSTTQITCATDVDFKIKDVCQVSSSPLKYKVVIENNGKIKLEKLIVRFYEGSDKMKAKDDLFANGIESYMINSAEYTPGTDLNNVKYVEAIPIIKISGKEVTCSANKQDFGDLSGSAITTPCTA
ncbi:MAG: archaellin/type IV pilin N-terminal domain-containing protein [Candidatus Nanoarchaeia archaeon]